MFNFASELWETARIMADGLFPSEIPRILHIYKQRLMDDYRFNPETEPTDEQLHTLMQEAAQEVRESNAQIRSALFARINEQNNTSL